MDEIQPRTGSLPAHRRKDRWILSAIAIGAVVAAASFFIGRATASTPITCADMQQRTTELITGAKPVAGTPLTPEQRDVARRYSHLVLELTDCYSVDERAEAQHLLDAMNQG